MKVSQMVGIKSNLKLGSLDPVTNAELYAQGIKGVARNGFMRTEEDLKLLPQQTVTTVSNSTGEGFVIDMSTYPGVQVANPVYPGTIWTPGHVGIYDQLNRDLQNHTVMNKDIERELRIAKLQEHSSLTPGQIIELEILLNKKWK